MSVLSDTRRSCCVDGWGAPIANDHDIYLDIVQDFPDPDFAAIPHPKCNQAATNLPSPRSNSSNECSGYLMSGSYVMLLFYATSKFASTLAPLLIASLGVYQRRGNWEEFRTAAVGRLRATSPSRLQQSQLPPAELVDWHCLFGHLF